MEIFLEIETPFSWNVEAYVQGLARRNNVTAIIIAENGGVSAMALAEFLKEVSDKQLFIKISCRDRNRIALHSDLLTAASKGLMNVVLVEGAHPIQTRFPAAKPVYELDTLLLLQMMKKHAYPFGQDLRPALAALPWRVGVCIGGVTAADLSRAEKLCSAGADLFFVGSVEAVEPVRRLVDKPVFVSLREEEVTSLDELSRIAESAGAQGVHLVGKTPDKSTYESIIRK